MHWNHHETTTLVPGKTVFHETSPWCPKGWGPLLQELEGRAIWELEWEGWGCQHTGDNIHKALASLPLGRPMAPVRIRGENGDKKCNGQGGK